MENPFDWTIAAYVSPDPVQHGMFRPERVFASFPIGCERAEQLVEALDCPGSRAEAIHLRGSARTSSSFFPETPQTHRGSAIRKKPGASTRFTLAAAAYPNRTLNPKL